MENVGEINQSAFRVIELTGANRFKMWNPDSTFFYAFTFITRRLNSMN